MKYEYTTRGVKLGISRYGQWEEPINEMLSEMSKDGWEYLNATHYAGHSYMYLFFRRPV